MQRRMLFSIHRFRVSVMAGAGSLTNRQLAPWMEKGNACHALALLPQAFRRRSRWAKPGWRRGIAGMPVTDANGNTLTYVDPNAVKTTKTYDGNNRVTSAV